MDYITTTNGALQHKNSGEKCLDLFSNIGNLRHFSRPHILEMFEEAFNDNPELATQVAFWARAAREGAGERKTFFTILDEIGRISPEFISNVKEYVENNYRITKKQMEGLNKVYKRVSEDLFKKEKTND